MNFEKEILIPKNGDELDCYREEYNNILLDKASNANGIIQEKYLTVSVVKKDIEEARPISPVSHPICDTFLCSRFQSVRNWTPLKSFVCFTIFTVQAKKKASVLIFRI